MYYMYDHLCTVLIPDFITVYNRSMCVFRVHQSYMITKTLSDMLMCGE